jgi:hypothetical protein
MNLIKIIILLALSAGTAFAAYNDTTFNEDGTVTILNPTVSQSGDDSYISGYTASNSVCEYLTPIYTGEMYKNAKNVILTGTHALDVKKLYVNELTLIDIEHFKNGQSHITMIGHSTNKGGWVKSITCSK